MNRANQTALIIKALILSSLTVACDPGNASKHASDTKVTASSNETAIVGTWKNSECTPIPLDKNSNAQNKLWYHETLTITGTTLDSVNTYFVDAKCTQQDSYQPTPTVGGLMSYRLGGIIAPDVHLIDFTPNVGGDMVHTVASLIGSELRFGDAKDANEDGKTEKTRLTQISTRVFTKVDSQK